MERPKIVIQREPIDTILEIIGLIGLTALIVLPLLHYSELPERIPSHYNVAGEPDGFSGKAILWTLPLIGLVLYFALTYLNKFPHIFSYPVEITKENAVRQYKNAMRMNRTLKVIISSVFAYITWATISTALGKMNGLGVMFLPIFLTITLGGLAYFVVKSIKDKKNTTGNYA